MPAAAHNLRIVRYVQNASPPAIGGILWTGSHQHDSTDLHPPYRVVQQIDEILDVNPSSRVDGNRFKGYLQWREARHFGQEGMPTARFKHPFKPEATSRTIVAAKDYARSSAQPEILNSVAIAQEFRSSRSPSSSDLVMLGSY
jgi:hypothetical protein